MSNERLAARRTSLSVDVVEGRHREIIAGPRCAWAFRPHYHAGDEIVHMKTGRALLRAGGTSRLVEAGETVRVPAGLVHRFEPVDPAGWSFVSTFTVPKRVNLDGSTDNTAESNLVAHVRGLLAERCSLHTDVSQIAEACALSKGHLSRRFRLESGASLHEFHVLIAVHHAKALLKKGYSIVEAALEAGFYDQAHLTREFVRTYGFTPGAFRSAWQAAPNGVETATNALPH